MRLTEIVKFHVSCRQTVLIGTALLTVATTAFAIEPVKSPTNSSTFSVLFENDLFGDTDQQYTNGVQLSWESPDLTRYADADRLPLWLLLYLPESQLLYCKYP